MKLVYVTMEPEQFENQKTLPPGHPQDEPFYRLSEDNGDRELGEGRVVKEFEVSSQ